MVVRVQVEAAKRIEALELAGAVPDPLLIGERFEDGGLVRVKGADPAVPIAKLSGSAGHHLDLVNVKIGEATLQEPPGGGDGVDSAVGGVGGP